MLLVSCIRCLAFSQLKNLEKQKRIFSDYYIYEYTPLLEITTFYVVPSLDKFSFFAVVWLSCSHWEGHVKEDESFLRHCCWQSAAIVLLKKTERSQNWIHLASVAFQSCPDLTHSNIFICSEALGAFSYFNCVVIPRPSIPWNSVCIV